MNCYTGYQRERKHKSEKKIHVLAFKLQSFWAQIAFADLNDEWEEVLGYAGKKKAGWFWTSKGSRGGVTAVANENTCQALRDDRAKRFCSSAQVLQLSTEPREEPEARFHEMVKTSRHCLQKWPVLKSEPCPCFHRWNLSNPLNPREAEVKLGASLLDFLSVLNCRHFSTACSKYRGYLISPV